MLIFFSIIFISYLPHDHRFHFRRGIYFFFLFQKKKKVLWHLCYLSTPLRVLLWWIIFYMWNVYVIFHGVITSLQLNFDALRSLVFLTKVLLHTPPINWLKRNGTFDSTWMLNRKMSRMVFYVWFANMSILYIYVYILFLKGLSWGCFVPLLIGFCVCVSMI